MKKGILIVIDGPDGSGKQTQTKLLVDRLIQEGKHIKQIDFPRYQNNFFGKFLQECLHGGSGDFIGVAPRVASVIYACDRWETAPQIKQWLDEGYVVIADRYVSANQIHQGGKVKDLEKRKEFLSWLDTMEHEVLGTPRPDVVVFLDVPVRISQELMIARSKEQGKPMDLAETNEPYLVGARESALGLVQAHDNWVHIECAPGEVLRSREDIAHELYEKIQKYIT